MEIRADIALYRDSGFSLSGQFNFRDHRLTAIYGPSGSGKTTLLRLLSGLEHAGERDRISIHADDEIWQAEGIFVPPEKRGVGFVFQRPQLFPHMTVRENLTFAQERRHRMDGLDPGQIHEWFALEELLDKPVTRLSGGEAQRVAIGRVLLNGARCILMDEPLGSVDVEARARILRYLDQLRGILNIPIIYVSHSFEEISHLADELYVLRAGRITAHGSLVEMSSSLELNVTTGEEAAAVVICKIVSTDEEFGLCELDFEGARLYVQAGRFDSDEVIRVRIPARDVSITTTRPENSSILNIMAATITSFQETGRQGVLVRLQCREQFILARITRKSFQLLGLQTGQPVYAQIKSVALVTDNINSERS